jgi:hypothetical protein
MKKSKFDIKTILIIGLCVFLLLRNCNSNPETKGEIVKVDGKKYEMVKQTIDTVVITKEIEVPTYVPKYITRVETVEVEIPADVDTTAILKEYFSKFQVKDTLDLTYDFPNNVKDSLGNKPNPTLGFGVITDVISQNKIFSRDVKWSFQIPTIYNTTIVKELPKTQLYYGFGIGGNKEQPLNNVSGGLILKTKRDNLYQLNIGVQSSINNGFNPYIGGGLYWKINLNKK